MNMIDLIGIPVVALGLTAITQVVSPDGLQLDSVLSQFLDVGLVGTIAVMFYVFWRMAMTRNNQLQNERLEELKRQRDAALEERDLWYEENMKQYRERLDIYQSFVDARGVVVKADEILPDELSLGGDDTSGN